MPYNTFNKVRSGELRFERPHYALSAAYGVIQAQRCGYTKLAFVELGVGMGYGLKSMCDIAAHYQKVTGIQIEVFGFDNATGLPAPTDYRDHPEIWSQGQFNLGDPANLVSELPPFCHLIVGDIANTIGQLEGMLNGAKLGFVVLDVDYYSSSKHALKIFNMSPDCYVPAVPMYADDTEALVMYNPWQGEELAMNECNQENAMRKILRRKDSNIMNFNLVHILDHPVRQGKAPGNMDGFFIL